MNHLTELQKEDSQLWFYSKIFVDKLSIEVAIQETSKELSLDPSEVLKYFQEDGRIKNEYGTFTLISYETDQAEPAGIYVDSDWMGQILMEQGGLSGSELITAFQIIYKLSKSSASEEISTLEKVEANEAEE